MESDVFLEDMVTFFDQNTDLIKRIAKWNILDYVTRVSTKITYSTASELQKEIYRQYRMYTTIYLWGRYFSVCLAWILFEKKETPEEMIRILKAFQE